MGFYCFLLLSLLSFQISLADEPRQEASLKKQRLISLQSASTASEPVASFSLNVISLNRPLVIDGKRVSYDDGGSVSSIPVSNQLRSPVVAGVFSGLVPGAGEFYAESYWRSALFLVAEIALWSTTIYYQNKGRQGERDFVAFADARRADGTANWDAVRFAERMSEIYTGSGFINPNVPNAALIRQRAAELGTPERLNEIRNRDFRFLNDFERIAVASTGATLSHTLPQYGAQQYYELIGKYSEYAIGWYDYDVSKLTNRFEIHSAVYLDYAAMRGAANDDLKTASNFISLIVLNHALSILDAVIATNQYNDKIRTSIQFQQDAMTQTIYPSASVAVSF